MVPVKFLSAVGAVVATMASATAERDQYSAMIVFFDACLAAARDGQTLSEIEIFNRSGIAA